MALTRCNSNKVDNRVSDTPKETVTLSKENFSTYVACNSSVTFNNTSYDYANYFTYFIGADYCKFINCTVTYGYAYMANEYTGTGETVPLTFIFFPFKVFAAFLLGENAAFFNAELTKRGNLPL